MKPHLVSCAPDYLPNVGGAEVGLHTLLTSAAPAAAFRHTVIVPTIGREFPRRDEIDGISVRRFRRPRRSAQWFAPTLAATGVLPAMVRASKPDLVHLSYALPTGIGGAIGARLAGVPYVCTLGGNDVFDPVYPPPEALLRVARRVARGARHVVCFSTVVRDFLIEEWGVRPERATANPFGVDIDRFTPLTENRRRALRADWGCRPDSIVCVAVQRLAARKGVDLLIDAVARLGDTARDLDVLVGGRGPEYDALQRQINDSGLQEQVRLVGFVDEDDKPDLLGMADVFVLPSRYEGQGISLAEAAACATAVIATSSGGTVDMVDDGVTGRLVPVTADAISAALRDAVDEPTLLRKWGVAGRRKAEAELSLDRTGAVFTEIIRGCATGE